MTEAQLLTQYFAWCEKRIEEQIGLYLRDLHWIGDDYVQFIVSWMAAMDPDAQKNFLRALLSRRLQNVYPEYFPKDLRRLARKVDWERFIAVGREKLLEQPWIGESRGTLRARSRTANAVAKEILRVEQDKGHEVRRQAKGEWFSDSKLEPYGLLRLYLAAGDRGLEYCQNLWVPSAQEPLLRESFLSWFGISEDTAIDTLAVPDEMAISEFVLVKCEAFQEFISSVLPVVFE